MVGARRATLDRCWRATPAPSRVRDGCPKRAEGVLPMTTPTDDPRLEAILREGPARRLEPLSRRDRLVETGSALTLVAVIAAMALWLPGPDSSSPWLAVALTALFTGARRVRFTVGSCTTGPWQVAVVPMLLLLHPALAVSVVVLGGLLSRVDDLVGRRVHPDHAILCIGDAWFAVGPGLVIALAGASNPSFGLWPVY